MKWPAPLEKVLQLFNRTTQPTSGGNKWWTVIPYRNTNVIVTHENALQLSACIACIRARAEDIAKMPWRVFRKVNGKRERQDGTVLDRLLNTRPNPEMGSFSFRVTLLLHAQGWGNGYAEIERDFSNRPIALWPLEPWRVNPKRNNVGQLYYEVQNMDATKTILLPEDIFHIHSLSEDGVIGMDTVANAALTLGFGIAAEQHGANFYSNNTTIGTSFKTPNKLSEKAFDNLKAEITDRRGAGKAFESMILQEGLEPVNVMMNQTDAQYLETRRFQVEEVCRHFRVPPHKVFDLTNAHFNNVEQLSIQYVQDSLMPWVKRLEEEADYKLTSVRDPRYTKIAIQSLMRGDMKTRMEFYQGMHRMGAYSINRVLELEDEDPIGAEGDEHFMQAQMRTVKSIIEQSNQPIQVAQPMVENMLKRFWSWDCEKAEKVKSKMDFSEFTGWVSKHHNQIKHTREKAIVDNLPSMEIAYQKEFQVDWILSQYNTWAVSSLIYFYKDQSNMIDFKAFTAYFLEALKNANSSEE